MQPKRMNKSKEGNKAQVLNTKPIGQKSPTGWRAEETWGLRRSYRSSFQSLPQPSQTRAQRRERQAEKRRFRLSRSHHLDGTTEGKWTQRGTSEEIIAQCFLELKNITIQKIVWITLICSNLHRRKETHHHFMRSCSWLCNFSDCAT